ncbi:MAG: glycerophosphodiester phosphodiesterase family protein [Kiritimatiellia bacterium]|nr:glycerophosphodiester phosphodiesterase family protein [Kiritimatiellia bacterium]
MKFLPVLAALAALPILAAEPSPETLIAHRGESVDAPENSLPAFTCAVERGFGFECDLYLSKDGRVFTFHDGHLGRITGGKDRRSCGAVTWSNDLSNLNVAGWGKWKKNNYPHTPPALFEDVLKLARPNRYIYAELKTGPHIVPHIKAILEKQTNATPENLLFISFNTASCAELKRQLPAYKVYWLTSPGGFKPFTSTNLVSVLKRIKADGVDSHFDPKFVTADLIKSVHDAGFSFHVWTIDRLSTAREAFKRGADTLTTNRAKGLLTEYRKQQENETATK